MIFLIEYDRGRGKLLSLTQFSPDRRAVAEAERLVREIELNAIGVEREIVLLEAQDEDSLRATHRRYFEGVEQLSVPAPR
ncbi:MAG: hypothetical protein KA371_04640 [Acidobacteria bacterium]|nr:hypothetical protein [Acidobacteriota bacterium]